MPFGGVPADAIIRDSVIKSVYLPGLAFRCAVVVAYSPAADGQGCERQ
ncbi:hypothetical protein ACH4OW_26750 [Streptomyces sp. NPDC017056]